MIIKHVTHTSYSLSALLVRRTICVEAVPAKVQPQFTGSCGAANLRREGWGFQGDTKATLVKMYGRFSKAESHPNKRKKDPSLSGLALRFRDLKS